MTRAPDPTPRQRLESRFTIRVEAVGADGQADQQEAEHRADAEAFRDGDDEAGGYQENDGVVKLQVTHGWSLSG